MILKEKKEKKEDACNNIQMVTRKKLKKINKNKNKNKRKDKIKKMNQYSINLIPIFLVFSVFRFYEIFFGNSKYLLITKKKKRLQTIQP